MKVILPITGICLALLIGAVWYMNKTEQQDSLFDTYQELQASELISKGWVPRIIPQSSYDILEEHRVDQDRVHVQFRFLPGNTAKIEETCTRQQSEDALGAIYKCKHGNGVVTVTLKQDGTGEILSDKAYLIGRFNRL
jgi:hypothetical protein